MTHFRNNPAALTLLMLFIPITTLFALAPGQEKTAIKIRREGMPIIEGIGFLYGRPGGIPQSKPPLELTLTVRITENAIYKLYYDSTPILTGKFRPGDNRILLPTTRFLEKSGDHELILETSANQFRFRYKIMLSVHLQIASTPSATTAGTPAKSFSLISPPPIHYNVEMYIRGHKAARSRKTITTGLPQKTRENLARAINPDLLNPRHPDSKHLGVIKDKEKSLTISPLDPPQNFLLIDVTSDFPVNALTHCTQST
jgi:hypothetical protein